MYAWAYSKFTYCCRNFDEHTFIKILIFQYGEEIMPGGSQEMIDAGCLEDVDRILLVVGYSFHVGELASR